MQDFDCVDISTNLVDVADNILLEICKKVGRRFAQIDLQGLRTKCSGFAFLNFVTIFLDRNFCDIKNEM